MKMITMMTAVLAIVVTTTGCGIFNGGGGGGDWGRYNQDPEFVRDMRWEHPGYMEEIYAKAGMAKSGAKKYNWSVRFCPATGRRGALGDYSCDSACTGSPGCVHANTQGGANVNRMYAGANPEGATIVHENFHNFLDVNLANPADHVQNNWHPTTVTLKNGQTYRSRDLIPNTRWPSPVFGPLTWVGNKLRLTSDDWSIEDCPYGKEVHE